MCAQSIDLKDKIAVVTGSGDLGEAIIEELIQNYVKVIICDVNLENAKCIVNKYKLSEDRLIALEVDTSVVRPTLLYIWRSLTKCAPPERSRRKSLDFGCDFPGSL